MTQQHRYITVYLFLLLIKCSGPRFRGQTINETRAAHDGKVGYDTIEYTFLYSIFYGMACLSMIWKLNIVGTDCRKWAWNINWGNVCSNFQRLLQSYLFRLLEFTKEFTRTLYRLDSRVLGEETYIYCP